MSLLGRAACWANGHWKRVTGIGDLPVYASLEETYFLDDDTRLKHCPRCGKVSLLVKRELRLTPSGAISPNPLVDDDWDDPWERLG